MADLCTLAQVHARMPELGTSDDAVISDMITAVSQYFGTYANRRFDADGADVVRTFPGSGMASLFIPELSATPTQVRVRNGALSPWRVVPIGDVILQPVNREIGAPALWIDLIDSPTGPDRAWPGYDQSVEITAKFGRATVPTDLREAAIQTVVNLYRARGSAGDDLNIGNSQLGLYDVPKVMPRFAYDVLSRYVRPVWV